MKTLSVSKAARNFDAVIDALEKGQEEIVLVRNRRRVARLVPELKGQTALEVFGDLQGILDKKTGKTLMKAITSIRKRRTGRLSELRNPWAG